MIAALQQLYRLLQEWRLQRRWNAEHPRIWK